MSRPADDEHRVEPWLARPSAIFRLDRIVAEIRFAGGQKFSAQFVHDGFLRRRSIFSSSPSVSTRHLFRREPEREVAGVMLDQKADEPFVRSEAARRWMHNGVFLRVIGGRDIRGPKRFGTAKST